MAFPALVDGHHGGGLAIVCQAWFRIARYGHAVDVTSGRKRRQASDEPAEPPPDIWFAGCDVAMVSVQAWREQAPRGSRRVSCRAGARAVVQAPAVTGESNATVGESHESRLLSYQLATDPGGSSAYAWVLLRAEPEKNRPGNSPAQQIKPDRAFLSL